MHPHVAALHTLAGLGRAPKPEGLGIPGPFGQVANSIIPADQLYEISGTQVALHDPNTDPSKLQPNDPAQVIGYFNNKYGDNGGKIVGTPDTVTTNGQTATAAGYTWIQVTVDGGELNGKSGFVATKYLAPRGWTAAHNGTVAAPPSVIDTTKPANEGDSDKPPVAMTGEPSDKWKPWIVGGLVVLGAGGILYALFGTKGGKKVRRRAEAHHRLRRIRRRRR